LNSEPHPLVEADTQSAAHNKHAVISEWVITYSDDLYSFACHKLTDEALAQDLVQETFVSVLQSYDSFRGMSNPKTWLFSILKNKIIDQYRSTAKSALSMQTTEQRRAVHMADQSFRDLGHWTEDNSANTWGDDIHLLDNPDFTKVMAECLAKLPPAWSAMVNAKYLLEKESDEICQELEVSPSNYWQILHRAKLALKKCIEHNWFQK
jgi:RNA polymerase sigma-70 factor (TIGR02943 family)